MQVRIEDVSPVEKKLIVEIPWATVNDRLTSAYRELSRSVQLRGFRKGKVPRSVLQRMYGKHVRAEVTSQLVRESFLTATSEHNLQPVSEPRVESTPEFKSGQPVSIEATFEVRGDVEAKDYTGMELRRRRVDVPDEAVDEALETLRREHTELLPIEGRDTTARTDVLTVSLKGTFDGEHIEQPRLHIDLGDQEKEPLPGLLDALTGIPIDVEDHPVELSYPEDHEDPNLAGKTAALTVSVLDARKKEIPELDDEFAKDVDRGETLEELRQSVRADLEKRQEDEIKREVRDAALKELIKRNPIPLASALIDRGIEYQYQQMRAMLGMWGMQGQEPELTDDMRERLRPSAIDTVRGELLLEAVAEQENVEVTDEEVDEHIDKMAKARGVPVARMRAELDRDDELDGIRHQVRRTKVLDLLVERASITEVDASELQQPDETESPAEGEAENEGGEAAAQAREDAPAESAGGDEAEPSGESE